MTSLLVILAASLCIVLPACTSARHAPLAAATSVDVARYSGRWYEIARLPMPFQKTEEKAVAEYAVAPDGTLSVHNRAIRPDGSEHGIRGYARILNSPDNSKLAVRFSTWFGPLIPIPKEGNYWILHVDDEYRWALVGTPDRKYLWILARTPKIPDQKFQELATRAKESGFDVSKLIHDPQH